VENPHNSPFDSGRHKVKLHEQTQRFILLLIFYLLGPILTLGIIGGIVLRKLPENARHWERTLAQQTGLHWEIESVEFCSPGFIRLHGVKILDDTAQSPVFFASRIDVRRITETRRERIFPGIASVSATPAWSGLTSVLTDSIPLFRSGDPFWQITASKSVLDFRSYSSEESALLAQNMLRKVLARLDSLADVPVQFAFEDIYVISEHSMRRGGGRVEADLFRLVQGNIYRTPAGIRSDWSFEIQNITHADRLHLAFTLSFADTLEIVFQTGRQAIPCDLAAVFYSPFQHFSGGTFQGEFALSTRVGRNSQTIRLNNAVFQNVPLAPLVSSYTDFAVMGTIADLRFEQAVFGTDDIYAVGALLVQNGAVEKALFHRCIDNFQLSVNPADILDSEMRMIPFTACAIHFRLQHGGIDFWADQVWKDAFMYQLSPASNAIEWIVRFPPHRRTVTYHELMSIFAADNAPVVPLTPGLQSILPHIPIQ